MKKDIGILGDKTINDKLISIDDQQNYPFCILELGVETFEHSTKAKFNESPQSC